MRNTRGVTKLAVYSSNVVKVTPNSRESPGLLGHERCPFMRVSVKRSAEPLVAMVSDVSPTAPHCVANLQRSLVAHLPVEPSRDAESVANGGDAPVDPVVASDVVGPEIGLCVPCIDVAAQGVLEDPVGVVIVVVVRGAGARAGCAVVVTGAVGGTLVVMGLEPPQLECQCLSRVGD